MHILDYIWLLIINYVNSYDQTPTLGFLIAFTVAVLNAWRQGKFKLAEALLCGVFSAIAIVSSNFLGASLGLTLPAGAYALLSGAIGWFGTDAVVDFLKARFNWGAPK